MSFENENPDGDNCAIGVSIVMPCLNEALCLPACLANAVDALVMIKRKPPNRQFIGDSTEMYHTFQRPSRGRLVGCCPTRAYSGTTLASRQRRSRS